MVMVASGEHTSPSCAVERSCWPASWGGERGGWEEGSKPKHPGVFNCTAAFGVSKRSTCSAFVTGSSAGIVAMMD